MSRLDLSPEVERRRIVAVCRHLPLERLIGVVEAVERQLPVVWEVTMDSADAVRSLMWLASRPGPTGAGTVRSAGDVDAAVESGAEFLVTPIMDQTILRVGVDAGVPVIVGALTPTEIAAAWDAGASAVKVFPASLGGSRYLATVRGPLSDVPMIPTGGIDADAAGGFLDAGAIAVGVGGWLTGPPSLDEVERRAGLLRQVIEAR